MWGGDELQKYFYVDRPTVTIVTIDEAFDSYLYFRTRVLIQTWKTGPIFRRFDLNYCTYCTVLHILKMRYLHSEASEFASPGYLIFSLIKKNMPDLKDSEF